MSESDVPGYLNQRTVFSLHTNTCISTTSLLCVRIRPSHRRLVKPSWVVFALLVCFLISNAGAFHFGIHRRCKELHRLFQHCTYCIVCGTFSRGGVQTERGRVRLTILCRHAWVVHGRVKRNFGRISGVHITSHRHPTSNNIIPYSIFD